MGQKFFVSFNSVDRTKAHWIAWTLKEAGHEVAVHDWEIPAGGNAPLWMNTKLAWADRLIAVISPDYVPSRYSPMEWASQIWNDPDGTKGSVIPVIVRPTSKMPPLLQGLSRIDLMNCSEDEARRRLIKGVDMPAPPELKPAFEKVDGERPDSQHVGPAEKPNFVPVNVPVVKLVVDLVKELLGFIDRGKKEKHEMFERVCKPLYDRLELVAKEYHEIVQKAARRLDENEPDFDSIVKEIEDGRAQLIILRNGVIGESEGFLKRYVSVQEKDDFARLTYAFAYHIYGYFRDSERLFYDEEGTMATGLISDILSCKDTIQDPESAKRLDFYLSLDSLRERSKKTLTDLERKWRELSKSYTDLKLYCET